MIAFSGLDGAGKSTQINLVVDFYNKKNVKSIVFWSRGGYTPGMLFVKKIFLENKNKLKKKHLSNSFEKSFDAIKREKQFSNPFIRKLWLTLSIFDLIFYYAFYIRYKELLGVKVICDRYLFDTLIDFNLNFPQENVGSWYLWKFLCFLAVKPKKHFVLTISVEESQIRSKLKNEPFPDTHETLRKRLDEYIDFTSKNELAIHILGTKSIKDIHNIIIKELS